jgi:hypothetical protein
MDSPCQRRPARTVGTPSAFSRRAVAFRELPSSTSWAMRRTTGTWSACSSSGSQGRVFGRTLPSGMVRVGWSGSTGKL